MSKEPLQVTPSIIQLIERFDTDIRVARATELAQAGHFLQAESLLSPCGILPKTSLEMDLLGRIHVQQGRLGDALRRWRDANRIAGNRSFDSEISTLLDYADSVNRRRKFLLVIVSSAWGIFTFSLVIHFYMRLHR